MNVACPSQVGAGSRISADFWHETRNELRSRLGEGLFVLPQCSAAGDQSPRVMVDSNPCARRPGLTNRVQSSAQMPGGVAGRRSTGNIDPQDDRYACQRRTQSEKTRGKHRSRDKWHELPACDATFSRKPEAYATEKSDSYSSNDARHDEHVARASGCGDDGDMPHIRFGSCGDRDPRGTGSGGVVVPARRGTAYRSSIRWDEGILLMSRLQTAGGGACYPATEIIGKYDPATPEKLLIHADVSYSGAKTNMHQWWVTTAPWTPEVIQEWRP